MSVGAFTRCEKPLRWAAFCEICRRSIRPPFYFLAGPVSQRPKTRYRCTRPSCIHDWQAHANDDTPAPDPHAR